MDPNRHEPTPEHHATHQLDGGPGTVAAARDHARAFLHTRPRPDGDPALADALLVVSELTTNALRHAPGPCVLELSCTRDRLTIAVSDTSAATPLPRAPDLVTGSGGFGWHLLRTLTNHLYTTVRPSGGKTVTAILPRLMLGF